MAACETNDNCVTRLKPAVVVPCSKAQSARKLLEAHGLWDKTRKLRKHDCNSVLIPVNTVDVDLLSHHLHQIKDPISVIQADLPPSKSERLVTPPQLLLTSASELLAHCDSLALVRKRLLCEVPSHWEKHGDLVLLPAFAFCSPEWSLLGQELWMTVARCTGARRVARQSVVSADGFRSPQVKLLLGANAVVQHVDNAIKYEYDLTRCMFSAGNITEKLRVAKFNCEGETVVDLYAGIGYFTLPYLVHAGASHVHACEWNPDAVTALRRNLELNHVDTRCTVYPGDNRQLKLRGIADRVNLGLIPSSEEGWPVACHVLKPSGGIMHVHGNVNSQTAVGEKLPTQLGAGTSVVTSTDRVDDDLSDLCVNRKAAVQQTQVDNTQTFSTGKSGDVSSKEILQTNVLTVGYDSRHVLSATTFEGAEKSIRDLYSDFGHERKRQEGDVTDRAALKESGLIVSYKSCLSKNAESCHRTEELPHNTCEHSNSHPDSASDLEKHKQTCTSMISQTVQNQCDDFVPSHQSPPCSKTAAWQSWGENVCRTLKTLLKKEHGGNWLVSLLHIEHVKSYAPHVHHIVLDIQCTPSS